MTDRRDQQAIFRILDASANRAAEGLRTLEEYARFALEDRGLTGEAKAIRHALVAALQTLPERARLTARAVASDCGTTLTADGEMRREDLQAVVASAAARVQQALRCIEEYAKPLDSGLATATETLRYRAYTLAASLLLMRERCQKLEPARLYLLIGGEPEQSADEFAAGVERLFQAGVDVVQLRDKRADDATIYHRSRRGAEIARRLGKLFIVNDRADIAVASGAQGVHVGQEELPVEAVRRVVGSELLIGVSTHNLEQVRRAVADGADYIGCGPTFPSQTKSFDDYPGLDFLRAAAAETTLPAYAIGGITLGHLQAVLATGIHGVAVSQAILAAEDPAAAVREWKARLGNGRAGD